MNVEMRTEAAQFPEKEYINGIFVAVWRSWSPSLERPEGGSSILLSKAVTGVLNTGKLKVHKIEIFFGFDFEICIISLLVM
jgi:hypothetical protein